MFRTRQLVPRVSGLFWRGCGLDDVVCVRWRGLAGAAGGRRGKKGATGPSVVVNEGVVSALKGGRGARVLLVLPDGDRGECSAGEALERAKELGEDLVLVAAGADPPVVRVASAAAMRRKEEAKRGQQRAQARKKKAKEVRLGARTEEHDLELKSRQMVRFLGQGRPVKVSVSFVRGSSWALQEPRRRQVLRRLCELVGEHGRLVPASVQAARMLLRGEFTPTSPDKVHPEHFAALDLLQHPISSHTEDAAPATGAVDPLAVAALVDEGVEVELEDVEAAGKGKKTKKAKKAKSKKIPKLNLDDTAGPTPKKGKAGGDAEDEEDDDAILAQSDAVEDVVKAVVTGPRDDDEDDDDGLVQKGRRSSVLPVKKDKTKLKKKKHAAAAPDGHRGKRKRGKLYDIKGEVERAE